MGNRGLVDVSDSERQLTSSVSATVVNRGRDREGISEGINGIEGAREGIGSTSSRGGSTSEGALSSGGTGVGDGECVTIDISTDQRERNGRCLSNSVATRRERRRSVGLHGGGDFSVAEEVDDDVRRDSVGRVGPSVNDGSDNTVTTGRVGDGLNVLRTLGDDVLDGTKRATSTEVFLSEQIDTKLAKLVPVTLILSEEVVGRGAARYC